jgi:septum formation protein
MLDQLGLESYVEESNYEEDMVASSDPYELVKFLALGKGQAVAKNHQHEDVVIIAADTFTILDNKFIGKPKDREEAGIMLKNFSGRDHKVITGLVIIDAKNNKTVQITGEAIVKFRDLDDLEIEQYIDTGEPMLGAGGYNMMDRGATLIDSISGDYYVIIGFPLAKLYSELRKMGVV